MRSFQCATNTRHKVCFLISGTSQRGTIPLRFGDPTGVFMMGDAAPVHTTCVRTSLMPYLTALAVTKRLDHMTCNTLAVLRIVFLFVEMAACKIALTRSAEDSPAWCFDRFAGQLVHRGSG